MCFVPPLHELSCWAGCVAAVMEAFPGLPLVGYERDEELALVQTLGFKTVGPLRVWAKINGVR